MTDAGKTAGSFGVAWLTQFACPGRRCPTNTRGALVSNPYEPQYRFSTQSENERNNVLAFSLKTQIHENVAIISSAEAALGHPMRIVYQWGASRRREPRALPDSVKDTERDAQSKSGLIRRMRQVATMTPLTPAISPSRNLSGLNISHAARGALSHPLFRSQNNP
jgi:hypothetical protein